MTGTSRFLAVRLRQVPRGWLALLSSSVLLIVAAVAVAASGHLLLAFLLGESAKLAGLAALGWLLLDVRRRTDRLRRDLTRQAVHRRQLDTNSADIGRLATRVDEIARTRKGTT